MNTDVAANKPPSEMRTKYTQDMVRRAVDRAVTKFDGLPPQVFVNLTSGQRAIITNLIAEAWLEGYQNGMGAALEAFRASRETKP